MLTASLLLFALQGDPIDRQLTDLMKAHHVPGMQIALMRGSQLVKYANYGYAELESKRLVEDSTRFEVASMSKIFTGLAIRQLLNDGKLRLDTKVTTILPLSRKWKDLEVQHLIGMSMGLGDDWDFYPWGDVAREFDERTTLEFFDSMPQLFPIGERHEYCSPAYAVLGLLIEKITGKHFSEFIRRRIFAPSGMEHSTFMRPGAKQPVKAVGYRHDGKKLERGYSVSSYLHGRADVGMLTTVKDLVRFVRTLESRRLVSNSNALWTRFKPTSGSDFGYGYGWYVEAPNGVPYHYHGGLFRSGFRSMLMQFPEQGVTIIVAMNNSGAPVREFVRAIMRNLAPEVVVPD